MCWSVGWACRGSGGGFVVLGTGLVVGADEVPVWDREEVPGSSPGQALDVLDGAGVVGRVPAADAEAEGDGPEHVPAGGAGRLGVLLGGRVRLVGHETYRLVSTWGGAGYWR